MNHRRLILLLLVGLTLPALLNGVETSFWQIGTFDEFLPGKLAELSLSKEGELRLAPEARAVFTPEEALALALAADQKHNLYVGTGHQGKVFRIDPSMKASLFFTAQEPDIFALVVGPDGALYVGSSPEGKIYRVEPDGKSKIFYDPKAKYIWALVFDAQGRLYVGTGDRGQIRRVSPSGQGDVFFESKQTHIMCLTLDREGNLLAGSVPNGLIYRITPQGKAFVLYQTNLPEIHELAVDSQGRIYAAALGSISGKGTPELFAPPAPGTTLPVTVTTVTAEAGAGQTPAITTQTAPSDAPTGPSFNRPAPQPLSFPTLSTPQGRGSLIRILPDSTVETVWSSNNESIFGVAVRDNHVLFSTDSNGRIFDLDPSRDGMKLTLLTETHETLATRLLLQGRDLYIATSNVAKLFHVVAAPAREGSYESPVKDTKFISRWGVLSWRGEVPAATTLEFYTRSGNADRPDATWADWTGPYRNPQGSPILSPPGRYVQWKAIFHASGEASPTLDEVTVAYLNQNLPPQIRSFNVSTAGERSSTSGAPNTSGVSLGGNVVTSTPSSIGFGPGPTSAGASAKAPVTLSWQAEDPNGDSLVYSLYIKAADEQDWHLLRERIRQSNFTLDPRALADGKYVARLVASDEESNPPALARRAELVSAPFWIDNTPPQVRVLKQTATSGGVEVQFQVEDSTSPLRSAEASVDGKPWRSVYSDDEIVDSRLEKFTIKAPRLDPGEHIIAIRAYDTAGNVGVGKAVIRIPAGGNTEHRD